MWYATWRSSSRRHGAKDMETPNKRVWLHMVFLWTVTQSSAVDFNITLNLTQLSSMGQPSIVLGSDGRVYCLPGQESWNLYVVPEAAFNTCTTNDMGFTVVGGCSKPYITINIITLPILFPNIPSFESGYSYYFAVYEVSDSGGSIVSNDPCVDGYKFSFQVVDHLDFTTDIAQSPASIMNALSISSSVYLMVSSSAMIYPTDNRFSFPSNTDMASNTVRPVTTTTTSKNAHHDTSSASMKSNTTSIGFNKTANSNTAIFVGVGVGGFVIVMVIAVLTILLVGFLVTWNRRNNTQCEIKRNKPEC